MSFENSAGMTDAHKYALLCARAHKYRLIVHRVYKYTFKCTRVHTTYICALGHTKSALFHPGAQIRVYCAPASPRQTPQLPPPACNCYVSSEQRWCRNPRVRMGASKQARTITSILGWQIEIGRQCGQRSNNAW
jgi:hypothetical protein